MVCGKVWRSFRTPLSYAHNLYLNGELVTDLVIPEGVTSIGKYAFYYCTSLTNITIPEGVTSIGGYAFSGCSGLTNITIPEGVTSIGGYAFWDCTSLASITIPESVESIGDYAFRGCTGLTDIYYTGTESEWKAISKGSYWDRNTGNYTIHYNYVPAGDEG